MGKSVEQAYFWTPEWQAKEREAEQAIAKGRVCTFGTMEEMIEYLDAQASSGPANRSGRPTRNSLPG